MLMKWNYLANISNSGNILLSDDDIRASVKANPIFFRKQCHQAKGFLKHNMQFESVSKKRQCWFSRAS